MLIDQFLHTCQAAFDLRVRVGENDSTRFVVESARGIDFVHRHQHAAFVVLPRRNRHYPCKAARVRSVISSARRHWNWRTVPAPHQREGQRVVSLTEASLFVHRAGG